MRGPTITLLVFDMDGVLVDTTPCHARAYGELWRRVGIDGPAYEEIAGRRTVEVVAKITAAMEPAPSREQIDEWVRFKQSRALDFLSRDDVVFNDTRPSLERLGDLGYSMALGTSASRDATELILRRAGIDGFFAAVVTGDEVDRGKPEPDIYLAVIERSRGAPGSTLVIEDSVSGIDAALSSGARVASVRTGQRADHERFVGAYSDLATLARQLDGQPE